jgi:hypothetical protein
MPNVLGILSSVHATVSFCPDGRAYESTFFLGGVRVGIADNLNSDGHLDLVTGAGVSGGPHVKVFDGLNQATLDSFFSYDTQDRFGIFVGSI